MSPLARALAVLVRGYQRFLSPLLPPRCRFAPSCSSYALQALQVHGAGRGSWLAVRRVARCHPFHPGGHDPVPAAGTPATPAPPVRRSVGDDGPGTARAPRSAPGLGALS